MIKRLLMTAALAALSTAPALAYDVYPGCANPGASSGMAPKSWYVDSTNGKSPADGGTGAIDKPWNSLDGVASGKWTQSRNPPTAGYTRPLLSSVPYQHVVDGKWVSVADTVGNPPVNPGDTINLMTGAYGDWMIGDYLQQVANSKFVTVQAAPGQHPVFTTMYVRSTNKWVFDGIEVKSQTGTNGNKNWLITVSDQGAKNPTADLVFTNMRISSQDNVYGLTQDQLKAQLRYAFNVAGTAGDGTNGQPNLTCVSITNSHIWNVRDITNLAGNKTLFSNNELDHFFDDGVIYSASGVTITHNFIHDSSDIGDGNHEDAMQGRLGPLASGVPWNKFTDILIDSNRIIRQLDPKLPFPTYLQGIDAFDGEWTNVTITNNILVTSACWGISSASTHNFLVAGNTVIADDLVPMPGNCNPVINIGGPSHQGPPGDGVWVANNLGNEFLLYDKVKPTVVHWGWNVALEKLVNTNASGAYVYNSTPGLDAWNNLLVKVAPSTIFRAWDPTKLVFDVTPAWGAAMIGAGTAAGVPSTDILGMARHAPFTAGAYGYPF